MQMLLDGVLNPRESGIFIAQNSEDIQIDKQAIKNVAFMIHEAVKSGEISESDFESYDMHTKAGDQEAVEWIFFVDLINFSFWMEDGSCFVVSYTSKDGSTSKYSGYFAACACVNRALDKGIPLTTAHYMAKIQEKELANIFKSDSGQVIPLLEERCNIIRLAGRVLLEKFSGSFYNCVQQCDQSAQSLLKLVVEEFESFRDFAAFKNKKKIAEEVEKLRIDHSTKSEQNGAREEFRQLYAVDVDMYLWLYRRKHAEEVEARVPFHKTQSSRNSRCQNEGLWHDSENVVMFKKFDAKEDVVGSQQLKQSAQKAIRQKLLENYSSLESVIEEILPKKENFKQLKCKDHLEMVVDHEGIVQFVKHRDFPYIPTLKLLHKYPFIMHQQQVDKGAIKFVLNGSNIMSPGLTSAGGKLLENCEKGTMVAVMAEGKQHAMAIGLMKLSSAEIKEKNSGIAIDNVHYLGDGLWRLGPIQ